MKIIWSNVDLLSIGHTHKEIQTKLIEIPQYLQRIIDCKYIGFYGGRNQGKHNVIKKINDLIKEK